MPAELDWQAINEDKEDKKRLVMLCIAEQCKPSSPIEELKAIGLALEGGDKVEIHSLTGGNCSYTYKVHLPDSPNRALHAKLSFPYAQLLPDLSCPVSRTENEFKMMQKFASLAPGCVATPYFCQDLQGGMKLLVSQWSPADEQWGYQFIYGAVDRRCAKRLAEGLASLHSNENFETSFNDEMRPFFRSYSSLLSTAVDGLFNPGRSEDRVSALGKEIGKDACHRIIARCEEALEAKQSLIHGDVQAFNILVEKKSNLKIFDSYGERGAVVLCDWEMSHVGPVAKDLGWFPPFPIACVVAHAINGKKQAAVNIQNFLDTFWEEYVTAMKNKGGPLSEDMRGIYRHAVGFSGFVILAFYYNLHAHMEFLPIDQGDTAKRDKVMESLGVLGLRFLQFGFGKHDPTLSLADLRTRHRNEVNREVALLLEAANTSGTRRSSVLRLPGLRVSDAVLTYLKE